MNRLAVLLALSTAACFTLPAAAGESEAASTVTGIYVEQAPGLLIDARVARAARGARVAEVESRTPQGKVQVRVVRLPAGAQVQPGDRLATQSAGVTGSALAGRHETTPHLPSNGQADCLPRATGR